MKLGLQESEMDNFSTWASAKKELTDQLSKIFQGHTKVNSLQRVAEMHRPATMILGLLFKDFTVAIKTL